MHNTIVLAADFAYKEHVITTIKSVCYHNKHIHFYLFNKDYPPAWFNDLNAQLKKFDCHIADIKVISEDLKSYKTYEHISSESTFYRYFIPTFIEANKLLYLDCDLVVTQDLSPLFGLDISNNFVAGAVDKIAEHFHQEYAFNAGVLLINNKLWKEHNITQQAITYTSKHQDSLRDADQSVLNHLFQHSWLEIDESYNYQTGYYFFTKRTKFSLSGLLKKLFLKKKPPAIIHYNSEKKPWNSEKVEYTDQYWFYRQLTWDQILQASQKI